MKTMIKVNNIINFILDIIYPIHCINCNLKNNIICDKCLNKIPLNNKETAENIYAVFDYQNPLIKKIIWALKYHHKKYLGDKMGQILYEYLLDQISDIKFGKIDRVIYVIPVPIGPSRKKKRGYNQAYSIARGFCNSSLNKIFLLKDDIVIKKIDTVSQTKITNRNERLKNVRGVFDIKNKELIKGRSFIIIDDVTTTGGTFNEIIKILKKNGAKNVIGFALAH